MINNISNFYDKLDLKYPEIAIALQEIDKCNPGNVKFAIPILTPGMTIDKPIENNISIYPINLQNSNNLELSNLRITNYIELPIQKKLCIDPLEEFIISDSSSLSLGGSISLIPKERYIKFGSRWIVCFVGGDVNKPKIISRYIE